MKTEDIEYQDGGITMRGYLAYDDEISGHRPGILVVHEAFGLGEHAMERARMLAELGFVALAADMFGDRMVPRDFDHAIQLITDLKANPALLRARASAALRTLADHPLVESELLGAIGFCFGGTTVLELARISEEFEEGDLRGVVSFHGALTTPKPAEPGLVSASVLVCTGADDPMIPPEQVLAFEKEMTAAGADWQVIRYGNTVHSFTNPEADGSLSPAIHYNELADERSWVAMSDFFDELFE